MRCIQLQEYREYVLDDHWNKLYTAIVQSTNSEIMVWYLKFLKLLNYDRKDFRFYFRIFNAIAIFQSFCHS